MILLVCARSGMKNEDALRRSVETGLVMQRIDLAAQHYLSDLRRAAHIDIRTGE